MQADSDIIGYSNFIIAISGIDHQILGVFLGIMGDFAVYINVNTALSRFGYVNLVILVGTVENLDFIAEGLDFCTVHLQIVGFSIFSGQIVDQSGSLFTALKIAGAQFTGFVCNSMFGGFVRSVQTGIRSLTGSSGLMSGISTVILFFGIIIERSNSAAARIVGLLTHFNVIGNVFDRTAVRRIGIALSFSDSGSFLSGIDIVLAVILAFLSRLSLIIGIIYSFYTHKAPRIINVRSKPIPYYLSFHYKPETGKYYFKKLIFLQFCSELCLLRSSVTKQTLLRTSPK